MKPFKELIEEAMRLFKADRYEEAALFLEEAVKLEGQNADALEALGVMYRKLNRWDDAIAVFQKLSRLNPESIMAHTNLSQIYMEQGKISEAEREQAEARRLTWKDQLKSRVSTQAQFSVEEQIERYRKVIEFDPKDVLGYFSLGSVYMSAQLWGKAEEAYRKALEVDPEHSSSFFGLGYVLQEQGKVAEAAKVFEMGIPIAGRKGDMIPFKKMSARLREIRAKEAS